MIFSLVGTFILIVLAWELTDFLSEFVYNLFGDNLYMILKRNIDGLITGEFSSLESFQAYVMQTKYGIIFDLFLSRLIKDITFEGNLTSGDILAPSLCELIIKIITFLLIFLVLLLFFKILNFLLNKVIKVLGFQRGNKILGGVIGVVKGIIIFGVLYVVMVAIANFSLNESLLNFVETGQVSSFLYENFVIKIINLFY